ncbi:TonB-dependent receptor [Tenacibaculum maritimum]|uniref:TonB-dependent receptor n=1 Tax=Tenacibaculum maritimum TaxID=107401 RepID=UPI0012E44E42|nr:TonB-dependent receptor [Tenacibaculum maritimum]CAA0210178.1 TonB-dependent outer membrane receptor [Tenacibaculum maritimum]
MIRKLSFVLFLLYNIVSYSQSISGRVYDEYLEPFPSATIRTNNQRAVSNADGSFSLEEKEELPFILTVTAIGYKTERIEVISFDQELNIILKENLALDEVVISASRAPERIIESPVTIERLGLSDISKNTSLSFYDGLANLKGVDMNENSIGLKSINTRGFSTFGNIRFIQLTDGIDISAPVFNFPVDFARAPELDVESVEILPGAASALYGANAFNGILLSKSKSPFEYRGISTFFKSGTTSQNAAGTNPFYNVGVRMAHVFSKKLAIKGNFAYFKGTDWYANDEANTNGVGGSIIPGYRRINDLGSDPNYDGVNVYGDEVSQNLETLVLSSSDPNVKALAPIFKGVRVSRTGYREGDLISYNSNNLKADASLYYRPWGNKKFEITWTSRFNRGNNNTYQGVNRFSLRGFFLEQHKLEFTGNNFFVRSYYSQGSSGDSFDTRFAAVNLNNVWKSNPIWYTEYIQSYASSFTGNNAAEAHLIARKKADTGRLIPGTNAFNTALDKITSEANSGVRVFDKTAFIHTDANYNLRDVIKWGEIQVGGSYRRFKLNSRGSIYTDKTSKISFDEFGLYSQLQKKFLDDRLKFTGSVRFDKSKNFDGNFSPRLSLSYGLGENKDHVLRASYQTGFRNPTTQDQYIGFFTGAIHVLGTANDNLNRYVIEVNNNDGTQATITGEDAINNSFSDLSVKNSTPKKAGYNLVKPEGVTSFEAGYRGVFNITNANILEIDLNGYYNNYKNFLAEKVAWVGHYGQFDNNGNPDAALTRAWDNGDITPFLIKTNSAAKVSSYGMGLGLKTKFFKKLDVGVNYTWNRFTFDQSTDTEFKPGFNTPEHKVNVHFGNANLFKNFGVGVDIRWQDKFLWQSGFLDGFVDARTVLDAQVNYRVPSIKSRFKLGGTNLFGKEYVVAPGSALIGSIYYLSWTIND